MTTTLTGKWLFWVIKEPIKKKKTVSNVREPVRVCPNITVRLCSEVPEVHRDEGRTLAAPRRSLASRDLPLFQMQHLFLRPLPPSLLPGSAPAGRTHSHPRKSGWWRCEIYTSYSAVGRSFCGCWSGRGQIRRRWHREIPGIPLFVVRNVALISSQPDKTAAGTRNAPQADEADGYLAKFLFNTGIFWTNASHAVCSIFSPVILQVKMTHFTGLFVFSSDLTASSWKSWC